MEVPGASSSYDRSTFEGDLARINVLRLRGDFDGAKELCRALLFHKPESEQAHALMGDLSLESGEYREAADWYEMAASHAPDSANLKRKADLARRRVEETEALDTARRMGIPATRGKMHLFAGAMLGLVVIVSLIAFTIGGQLGREGKVQTINDPLMLSPAPAPGPDSPDAPKIEGFKLPSSDQSVLDKLKSSSTLGSRILLAYRDPRGPMLVVSLEAPPGEFTKVALSTDAATLLAENTDVQAVGLRYLRGGEPLAMARLLRADADKAKAEGRTPESALTEIWPAVDPDNTSKASTSETPAAPGESVSVPVRETIEGP